MTCFTLALALSKTDTIFVVHEWLGRTLYSDAMYGNPRNNIH